MKQDKANRTLSREYSGHSKNPFPTTQEMTLHMDIEDGQYPNQTDYVPCSQRGEAVYIQQKQDLELTMVQIVTSLLKNSGLN